jgi:hypothetical protein
MTADGYMSAFVVNSQETPSLPQSNFQDNTDEDIAKFARVYTSYCGRVTLTDVNGLEDMMHTKVEFSSDPSWVGGTQVRKFKFERVGENDYMILQPAQSFPAPVRCKANFLFPLHASPGPRVFAQSSKFCTCAGPDVVL